MLGELSDDTECSFEPRSTETDRPVVKMVSRRHVYPLRFQVTVKRGSAVDFYEQVTRHLLQTVQDLRTSEHHLCAALTKKDREIQEFKAEGGQLLLKYLKTPVFNEEKHRSNHSMFRQVFGDEDHILNHILEIAARKAIPKVEKVEKPTVKVEGEVKEELLSPLNERSNGSAPGASVLPPGASVQLPSANVQASVPSVQPPSSSIQPPGAELKRASELPPPLPKKTKKKFLNM